MAKKIGFIFWVFSSAVFLSGGLSFADTVKLKDGRAIEGDLKEVSEDEVVIGINMESAQGTTRFRLKREAVEDINGLSWDEAGAKLSVKEGSLGGTAEELATIGTQHYNAGQFDEAIKFSEKALAKAADKNLTADILFNLSSSYLEKGIFSYVKSKDGGFYVKSIEYAKKCLEIKPDYWEALANIATAYMNMGNLEQAGFYYEEAEKYANPNSPYYQQLIFGHIMMKNLMEEKEKTIKE